MKVGVSEPVLCYDNNVADREHEHGELHVDCITQVLPAREISIEVKLPLIRVDMIEHSRAEQWLAVCNILAMFTQYSNK